MTQLEGIERSDHLIIIVDSIGNLASKKEVEDAVDFADKSPQPDLASILIDVDSGLLGGK